MTISNGDCKIKQFLFYRIDPAVFQLSVATLSSMKKHIVIPKVLTAKSGTAVEVVTTRTPTTKVRLYFQLFP